MITFAYSVHGIYWINYQYKQFTVLPPVKPSNYISYRRHPCNRRRFWFVWHLSINYGLLGWRKQVVNCMAFSEAHNLPLSKQKPLLISNLRLFVGRWISLREQASINQFAAIFMGSSKWIVYLLTHTGDAHTKKKVIRAGSSLQTESELIKPLAISRLIHLRIFPNNNALIDVCSN